MPDIASTCRSLVLSDATVSGLVGTRMYSDTLPQSVTMPAIRYTLVDTLPNECLGSINSVSRARLQIDSYSNTRGGSVTLAQAVRLSIQKKYQGDNSGQYIHEISLHEGEKWFIVRPESGSDQRWYVTTLEFFVFYTTTTS